MSATAVLETRGLRKGFGGVSAVDGVSLALPRGELRALIGPNGAGKTTPFNMLTGQLRADAGEVRFKGQSLTGLRPHQVWRRGVSRAFQITATFASLTGLENVQVARLSHRRRTYSLLERAARLKLTPGAPLLRIDRVPVSLEGARVEWRSSRCDTTHFVYAVTLA